MRSLVRGIEREALRMLPQGTLARDPHPAPLGSALTNRWITTDFSESLLELITGVHSDVDGLLNELGDVHHFVMDNLGDQVLWPQSMPCHIDHQEDVPIAQYGRSHVGQMKTLYREGLKRRYGAKMQSIAGVHFNFSLPDGLWQQLKGDASQETKSSGYFHLIRNFRHQSWILPYLFGASPVLCPSFLDGKQTNFEFETLPSGKLSLPYATSLRMSDLGYTNSEQSSLQIRYNSVEEYVSDLKRAIRLPSERFAKLGVVNDGERLQLNGNILQIENELYSPIRPKRTTLSGETPSDALARDGVEYIEVRTLDVNPFAPLGIDETQIRLLDLFLLDCVLLPSPCWTEACQQQSQHNFDLVVSEGRRPGLKLDRGCNTKIELSAWLAENVDRWQRIAQLLDGGSDGPYHQALAAWRPAFSDPEQTLSGKVMALYQAQQHPMMAMAQRHKQEMIQTPYRQLSEARLVEEAARSVDAQAKLEAEQSGSFDEYLQAYMDSI